MVTGARAPKQAAPLDVLIFGGGAAGLWLLDVLVESGHSVLLLEADRLGAGQTVCAQGIIHGGFKYSLAGRLMGTGAAVREMPGLWRRCLAGTATPRLTGTRLRAEHCFLWSTRSIGSALTMVAARVALQAAPRSIDASQRPAVLQACPGSVAILPEPVIDPVSLLADLGGRHRPRILRIDSAGVQFKRREPGNVSSVTLARPGGGDPMTIEPRALVFTAGAGNEALCAAAGLRALGRQQRRPLHMLMARGDLPELNGHCIETAGPRATISSHTDSHGRVVWQVGGRIAEEGVPIHEESFIRRGAAELRAVLPGLDMAGVELGSYRVDRAEGAWPGGRPDDVMVGREGNVIVAWPTKLCLAPRLAERVAAILDPPAGGADAADTDGWPRPEVASPPWEGDLRWFPAA